MENQRLRNLTTHILHTKVSHVYEDIEILTGINIMTHQIPSALKAIQPFLEKRLNDDIFFDNKFDLSHLGNTDIKPMDEIERELFLRKL